MNVNDIQPFVRYSRQIGVTHFLSRRINYDCRLFYVLDGKAFFFLNGQNVCLEPGCCLLIPSGTEYECLDNKNINLIVLNFDYTWEYSAIIECIPQMHPVDYNAEHCIRVPDIENAPELKTTIILRNMQHLENSLKTICLESSGKQIFYRERISSVMRSVLVDILRCNRGRTTKNYNSTDQLLSYVQKNFRTKLTAKMVSEAIGYHENHINRLMHKATGMTLHQYIILQRMSLAKELLISTDMTVEQIAEEIGYGYVCNFSSHFKRLVGDSPLTYREKNKYHI